MITDEMIQYESGEPDATERSWFRFVREVEALLGLVRVNPPNSALDGDSLEDGYSLDAAFIAHNRGASALEYAQEVNLNRHALGLGLLVPPAGDALAHLIEALEQWKCPACGGTGRYKGFSHNAPNGGPCKKCADTDRLHPVAFAALQKVRTK